MSLCDRYGYNVCGVALVVLLTSRGFFGDFFPTKERASGQEGAPSKRARERESNTGGDPEASENESSQEGTSSLTSNRRKSTKREDDYSVECFKPGEVGYLVVVCPLFL